MRRRSWLVGVLVAVFLVSSVSAHNPRFVPDTISSWRTAYQIPAPEISWAYYGRLAAPGEVDFFTLDAQQGKQAYVQMTIPVIQHLRAMSIDFALVGPGLPAAHGLPVKLPAGFGAIKASDTGITQFFHEPFTGTNYWIHQTLDTTFPQSARYYILLWSAQHMVGKYTLAVGDHELFLPFPAGTLTELATFFQTCAGPDVPYPCASPLSLP